MNSFLDKIRPIIENRVSLMPDIGALSPNTLDFCDIFNKDNGPAIIAEIKFASPSCGTIYNGPLNHVDIARGYLNNGASALSILTEPEKFHGDISYIREIRDNFPDAHILLKDFVLSKKQIDQGLVNGANAVLLIAAFLEEDRLKELYNYALSLGLTPLVEVHTMEELQSVKNLSPIVIGINNRSLQDLKVDLDNSRELIQHMPENCYAICESGIANKKQIDEMTLLGFDGFLIGSSFMRHPNPGTALHQMLIGDFYAN